MLVYRSDDLGETEEFLSANYAPMRIGSGTDGPSPATIVRSAAESLSIDHLDLRFSMHYEAAPLGKICLCDIESGRVLDHSVGNGPAESFGPGRLFSLAPPDRPYVGTIDRARYSIVMFDPALLDELVVSATATNGCGCSTTIRSARRPPGGCATRSVTSTGTS
ncbi:hypothetical protein [Pseudonocardia hydrocarbonoxydans]|uniref:Uncharacterized protein n=1 Tax=Pseudonocardia hydrocarbonoxydans TaxID=76726 RepID=A0A4Y3WNR9_9PSEU|nr:hypothetical protein [Pseudonocardia hydrocarbonoxydans]GEC20552.1 hypothetical protein PHY01_28350 [Pseudonocardia hydrocarbonoxydans]